MPGTYIVRTSMVELFHGWLSQLIEMREVRGYGAMGLGVGSEGVGKSTALRLFVEGLPSTNTVGVFDMAPDRRLAARTPEGLLRGLLASMGRRAAGAGLADLVEETVRAIRQAGISLFVLDAADALTDAACATLCSLFDAGGCSIALIGTLALMEKFQHNIELWSRMGPFLAYRPPSPQEVLEQLIPSLLPSHCRFDPTSAGDRGVGEAIWNLAHPSLGDLRRLLQEACPAGPGLSGSLGLEEVHRAFPRVVRDRASETWTTLLWVVACAYSHRSHREAYAMIRSGSLTLNERQTCHWWWIVQAGDEIGARGEDAVLRRTTLDEGLIRQANEMRRQFERLHPTPLPLPYD